MLFAIDQDLAVFLFANGHEWRYSSGRFFVASNLPDNGDNKSMNRLGSLSFVEVGSRSAADAIIANIRPLMLMTNPYESPHVLSRDDECTKRMHPDWTWMACIVYAGSAICMFGILGKTNPPNSSVIGFGHGVIPGPAILGDVGFSIAIPLLAMMPTCLIAIPMRVPYRNRQADSRTTRLNFVFLAIGLVLAILNASLYRAD